MESNTVKMINMRAQDGKTVYIEYHDALVSTAALAKQYAEAGYADRYAVFAAAKKHPATKRTKEREEAGVYLSIILRPALFPSQAIFLGHLSAVSLFCPQGNMNVLFSRRVCFFSVCLPGY